MNSIDSSASFKDLISGCKDAHPGQYEKAWREFLKRYKNRIYQIVLFRCQSWGAYWAKSQQKDIINDIVSQVFITLNKALGSYRELNNESYFLLWLATICNRTVSAYFKKNYSVVVSDMDIQENPETIGQLPLDNRWELFEFIKQTLTNNSALKKNAHRDLLIFLLYTWANFSEKEIREHHCFNDLGARVVEVTVSRNRKVLKENFSV